MTTPPAVTQVVIQLDLAEAHEVEEWRAAQFSEGGEAAVEALENGEFVLGSLYVEATFGPGEEDVAGLTIAGFELHRGEDPVAQVDDEWIEDALAECADQLADEQGIAVTADHLRGVLTVQASQEALAALIPE